MVPLETRTYTDSEWDASVCPDGETCARNCAAGAVNQETWEGTYGVKQHGNGVDVGFVTHGPYSVNVGSRSYMMQDDQEYKLFSMLQKEISFEVDLSNMPCGTNAAIYFAEMDKTGNKGALNKAGAPYGTGYCDGQCARDLKWVNGKANSEGWIPNKADPYNNSGEGNMGACCAEMDLWEANKIATAFTPHPAQNPGLTVCMKDEECGSQDGDRFISPTDRNRFAEMGGMKAMGEALDRGMVLVISMWDDIAVSMNWLDSYMGDDPSAPGALRGPCDPAEGKPENLREAHPDAGYTVTNIKWGDFGTTTSVSDVVV